MPDGRILSYLDLSSEEVLEMSEPVYRRTLLRQEKPLTEPVLSAVETSVERERERIEEFTYPKSGAQKWLDISSQIHPRWAEVIAELEERENYAHTSNVERRYKRELSNNFRQAEEMRKRLEHNPADYDIQEYVLRLSIVGETFEKDVK